MQQYECMVCGYLYDPAIGDQAQGIPPGIEFAAVPHAWTCPECGADKDSFEPAE